MRFYSPHANMQVICSKTLYKRHPVTGDVIETVPAIWANFGQLGAEYRYANPETGEQMQGADIKGHHYDTDVDAAQHGWYDDTKAMVERAILKICCEQPDRIQQIAAVSAPLPWPAYNELEAEEVVQTARTTGLAEAALAYERENRQRPYVLQALAAAEEPEPGPEPEPAPKPEPEPGPEPKAGRTITV